MILVTAIGRAEGSRAAAAALACAAAEPDRAALLIELADGRNPRPTLVASGSARRLEERLAAHLPEARVASRGRVCHLASLDDEAGMEAIVAAAPVVRDSTCVAHIPPARLHAVLERPGLGVAGVLLRADLDQDRALTALVARELIGRGLRVAVLKHPLAWVNARLASVGALPPTGGRGLPRRVLKRIGVPSHSCYAGFNDKKSDSARASEQQRRDHAGARSR